MPRHTFTSSRTTEPYLPVLLRTLKAQDATAGLEHVVGTPEYTVKKNTAWTGPQIAFVQSTIDAAAPWSPQLEAQYWVDTLPLGEKALLLTLIDEINNLRSRLQPPLPAITPAQAVNAVRVKAGTLS